MDLVARVKAILMTPRTEWSVIAHESGDPGFLFPNYVAKLALITPVCGFIGGSIFGPVPLFAGLFGAIFQYVLTFVVVYVLAVVVDMLAPTFGGQRDFGGALKLVVYSSTPMWLTGIFLLVPPLRFLTILGLYGIYLLWTGLPTMMRSPPAKTPVYALAIFVCALLLGVVVGLLLSALFGFPRMM
jgi:hypothetical protein